VAAVAAAELGRSAFEHGDGHSRFARSERRAQRRVAAAGDNDVRRDELGGHS